mgnify:CR=1 FL=1
MGIVGMRSCPCARRSSSAPKVGTQESTWGELEEEVLQLRRASLAALIEEASVHSQRAEVAFWRLLMEAAFVQGHNEVRLAHGA